MSVPGTDSAVLTQQRSTLALAVDRLGGIRDTRGLVGTGLGNGQSSRGKNPGESETLELHPE